MTTISYISRTIILIALAAAMCCCSDDDIIRDVQQEEGCTVEISVPFAARLMTQTIATGSTPGSRAYNVNDGIGQDYMPHDIWLLQFGPDNKRIGSPAYYDLTTNKTPTVKIVKSTVEYPVRYIVIANTNNPNFNDLKTVADINQLKNIYLTISEEKDLFVKFDNTKESENYELLMNGEGEVTTSGGIDRFVCTLYRNVAKVEFTISNAAGSGMEIFRARVGNVAPQLLYADRLLADEDLTEIINNQKTVSYEWVDYNGGIKEGNSATLAYYISRNKRGAFPQNTAAEQKNNYAPDNATYIDILAKRTSDGSMFAYRFYLGANLVNDFNIVPNNLYTYNITINACGVQSFDSRVHDYSPVELESANSYIINPTFVSRTYSFPISRINEFWSDPIYVVEPEQRTGHTLVDRAEWVAEVIWQDIDAPVIKFINSPDGKCTASDDGSQLFGKYPSQRVYFATNEANYSKKGNVLIGVRLKNNSDGYLWSWHLWITDYNPDDFQGCWEDGKYIYKSGRMNGEIHRYAPVERNIKLWGGENPKYMNKFMMDRPLGANSTEFETNKNGLLYHYGRKDPIAIGQLYDIGGKQLNGVKSFKNMQVKVYEGVLNPTTFYYGKDYNSQFSSNTDIIWSDYKCTKDSDKKSIFDPCPPGWKIPEYGTFASYESYKAENNCRIFKIAGASNDATVRCPIGGYYDNAAFVGDWSGYWDNAPASEYNGYIMWFRWDNFYERSESKRYAVFVRPVKE